VSQISLEAPYIDHPPPNARKDRIRALSNGLNYPNPATTSRQACRWRRSKEERYESMDVMDGCKEFVAGH
jgi:hypothetical protein